MKTALFACSAAALLGLALPAQAEEQSIGLGEALALREVRVLLDPAMKLVRHDETPPALVETSPPVRYEGVSFSVIPLNVGRTQCEEAVAKAFNAIVADARRGGYDVIFDARPSRKERAASDLRSFACTTSTFTARVYVSVRLGMTAEGRARAESAELEAEKRAAALKRAAAKGAIYVPLGPILASEEAKAIVGSDLALYLGSSIPPKYSLRFGPSDYVETAEGGDNVPPEQACRYAVLKALESMAREARANRYNALIRVRSHLNGELTPSVGDVECELGRRSAKVVLRATLVQRE